MATPAAKLGSSSEGVAGWCCQEQRVAGRAEGGVEAGVGSDGGGSVEESRGADLAVAQADDVRLI